MNYTACNVSGLKGTHSHCKVYAWHSLYMLNVVAVHTLGSSLICPSTFCCTFPLSPPPHTLPSTPHTCTPPPLTHFPPPFTHAHLHPSHIHSTPCRSALPRNLPCSSSQRSVPRRCRLLLCLLPELPPPTAGGVPLPCSQRASCLHLRR